MWKRELLEPGEGPFGYREEIEEAIERSEAVSLELQGHIAWVESRLAKGTDTEARTA